MEHMLSGFVVLQNSAGTIGNVVNGNITNMLAAERAAEVVAAQSNTRNN
jgi:hypothetical protein